MHTNVSTKNLNLTLRYRFKVLSFFSVKLWHIKEYIVYYILKKYFIRCTYYLFLIDLPINPSMYIVELGLFSFAC